VDVIAEKTWRKAAHAHAARVESYVSTHLARREAGIKHPVHDFLFTYYSHRPAALRQWHPGYGVGLAGAMSYDSMRGYAVSADGVATVCDDHLGQQVPLLRRLLTLLCATASRPGTFGCFGLHEWAMVYRSAETRHDWPLRLGSSGTDAVVDSHRIGCSHFDAFRFFTAPARPLNTLQPGRDDRASYEQPGCLHANMDLYGKVAVRLMPLIASALLMDAFELAWDIRILDMRAAPYDLTGIVLDPTGEPWTPVCIETADGKAEYVTAQKAFSERARPIRERLVVECERLLAAAGPPAR
jgi:hypothetical protein